MRPLWVLSDWLRHKCRLRREEPAHAWGKRGEDLAHRFLQKLGYVVVARNWRAEDGSGELDLLAWDGASLVVVEVKTRESVEYGRPEEAVDREKQRRIARTAARYFREAGISFDQCRFDIVSVLLREKPAIEHIRNAFPRPL